MSDFDDILAPETCCHKFLKNFNFGHVSWLISEIFKNQFFAFFTLKSWMDLAAIFFKLTLFLFPNFWHQSQPDGTSRRGSNLKLKFFSVKAKNVVLTKNPQFLSDLSQNFRADHQNFCDDSSKFELNRTKIVDFSLIAKFWLKFGN